MQTSLFISIWSFYYLRLVNAYVQPEQCSFPSSKDPWDLAQLASSNITRHFEPKLTTVSQDDAYFDMESGKLLVRPSRNYAIDKQKLEYAARWHNSVSDYQKCFYKLVKESSDMFNNTEATYTMYRMHLYSDYGIPHNKSLAWEYLQKFNILSKGSNSSALFDTAIAHITGFVDEIPVNRVKGLIYLRKAAALGSLEAKQALAYRFLTGTDVPKSISKAQILYGSLFHDIYHHLSPAERMFYDAERDIYNVYLPDLYGGIFLEEISQASHFRHRPLLGDKEYISDASDAHYYIAPDPLMDICHKLRKATEYYSPTYTQHSEYSKAFLVLNDMFERYDSKVSTLHGYPQLCYAMSVELLGHMWLTGKGVDGPDVEIAEKYLSRAIKIVSESEYKLKLAEYELGAIYEHIYGDFDRAAEHYYNWVLIQNENPKPLVDEEQTTSFFPFIYTSFVYTNVDLRDALLLESLMTGTVGAKITKCYASALERDSTLLAPGLRDAFMNLLLGNNEVALWYYLRAAEQGLWRASGSAAFLLYQPSLLFEEEPQISDARLKLAVSYYKKGFSDGNTVAGDIFFKMGEYKKAAVLYNSDGTSKQASWNLAYLYEHGLGLKQDYPLAIKHYEDALSGFPVISLLMKPFIWRLMLKSWIEMGKWRQIFRWF